ncbi:unnamed protein product [Cylindrotheca closterium]|uniref:Uncharacterized protein n=1 Tax=Cylindrotheca closterium TaxID=2856 RepID=A0AAD2G0S0_9STRA|nr:unnamed protein product [Cylindrotheca closterium]
MTETTQKKKKTRKKSTDKIVKSKAAIGIEDGTGRKKKKKSSTNKAAASKSLDASSTKKTKQKRGRSTTKKNLKKGALKNKNFQESLASSVDTAKSTNKSNRSQNSFNQLRPSSLSDLRAPSQDTAASGRGRTPGRGVIAKRPRSATGLDHSGHLSIRRLEQAERGKSSSSLFRQSSNPNLSRQYSNPNLSRQNSGLSLGGGSRPRSLVQRARSTSTVEPPSSFTGRRMNRLGARGLKKSGSTSGLSRQSSRSSLYASSDDDGGSRSRSRSRTKLGGGDPDDLEKIIGMIESSNNPEILARQKPRSRYERFAQRNRLSSRSLDASVSGHTASTVGDEFSADETIWISGLRYIRLMAPTPRECKSDRIIRYMTWGAMILDFIAAMVSITTYESVTMCCGKPIFELLESRINWNEFVRIFTYIYVVLLFLEVIPVFNKEIPLNLINPLIGFTITMAMFFDDRIGEAITMWTMEAFAIAFEAVITCLRRKQHLRRIERIVECDDELAVRTGKRWARDNSTKQLNPADGIVEDPYSDLESLSGGSFYNSGDAKVNRFRIERERRHLKAGLLDDEITLRYHYIGSAINIGLVLISLSLIIGIGKNGGLCISNFEAPPIFKDDQLERCPSCVGAAETCEVCDATGGNQHQCYYPYKL